MSGDIEKKAKGYVREYRRTNSLPPLETNMQAEERLKIYKVIKQWSEEADVDESLILYRIRILLRNQLISILDNSGDLQLKKKIREALHDE